jgi:hypothetical protein
MTQFWHYMFAPTNKKPEASHEAFLILVVASGRAV